MPFVKAVRSTLAQISVHRTSIMCAALFVATALLFSRALDCDFINYDDPAYVTENVWVQRGLTWSGVVWAFTAPNDYWHPLTWISHMLDWQLFGGSPAGHHLSSVLWHAANAALAFLVFLRLAGGFWTSVFAAALFAWHPLRVESVVWVTERKDVMSGFFLLLTLLAYMHYAAARASGGSSWRRYLLVVACFVAGLMSKPMLVTLPILLLLLDWWPLRRATARGAWKRLVLEKIPLFVISGAVAVATVRMQADVGAFVLDHPLGARLGNAVVSIARYLGKFFWPADLSVIYAHPGGWPAVAVVGGSVLLAALIGLGWWQRKSRPWLSVGICWFLVSLLPVLGLFQVGYQSMADRFTYVPVLGVGLALVWSVPGWESRAARIVMSVVGVAILAAFAWQTWSYQAAWRDSLTLMKHAVKMNEQSDDAHELLASALYAAGRFGESEEHAARALELNARNDRAHVILGSLAQRQEKPDEALAHYRAALEIRPADARIMAQSGFVELERGEIEKARRLIVPAIRQSVAIRNKTLELADSALQLGNALVAKTLFEFVIDAVPGDPAANAGLGRILAAQNNATDAIGPLRIAAKTLQDDADILITLARCSQQLGHAEEAGAALKRGVALAPDDPAILAGAADVHARRREFDTAIELYRRAIKLAPDDSRTHAALGFLLIYEGDREGGVAAWKRALEIDPDFPGLREQLKRTGRE